MCRPLGAGGARWASPLFSRNSSELPAASALHPEPQVPEKGHTDRGGTWVLATQLAKCFIFLSSPLPGCKHMEPGAHLLAREHGTCLEGLPQCC